MNREHSAHARDRELGVAQQAGGIREAEQLGEMHERARALLAADHDEMVLVAVQIRHEDDAGLVEPGRRLEDVPRERHGRRQDLVERRDAILAERRERGAGRQRDRIEDAEQGIAVMLAVAGDQQGVVEVVAGVLRTPRGRRARSTISLSWSSSDSLMPSTLATLSAMIPTHTSMAAMWSCDPK